MHRNHRVVAFAVGLALAINLIVGLRVHSGIVRENGKSEGYAAVHQLMNALQLVRKNYVDEDKVGYQDLMRGALSGMLSSLDRFSSFIPPTAYEKMKEDTEGEFGGIGIVISVKDDALTIVAPMDGSPGMAAGLRPKDKIIRVGDQDTTNIPLDQAVGLIKGEPGTVVELTVFRPSTEETLVIEVERAIIEIATVKDVHFVEPGIAYVRITQFNEKTAEKLQESLLELMRQHQLHGLVIDVRNNPGGLLRSAIDVCSMFVPEQKLIVFTQGRRESQKHEYFSEAGLKFTGFPMAILINEGSASAAEILAGCLQDYKVASLIGETSFGKGSVQSIIEQPDGSAIRLTTARYFTPSERLIHGKGIEPDFVVDIGDQDTYRLYLQRTRVIGADDPAVAEKDDIEDVQLARAIDVLKGKPIPAHESIEQVAKLPKDEVVPTPVPNERVEPTGTEE